MHALSVSSFYLKKKYYKMATSQRHLASALKILILRYSRYLTSHANKLIVCDKHVHGWQRKRHKINVLLATKRRLAQKFVRWPTLTFFVLLQLLVKGKRNKKICINESFSQFKFLISAPCDFFRVFFNVKVAFLSVTYMFRRV